MDRLSSRKLQGFTLLEILITVVVLSTGLVLVLQGLHSVMHIWHRGVQRTRSLMTAQETFSRARHDAMLGLVPQSGGDIRVENGVGGHDGLFRLTREDAGGDGRVYEQLLYVSPDDEVGL